MNMRKLRRIQRERSGRGTTQTYRVQGERWKSTWYFLKVYMRMYVTSGNFWRTGIKTNFQ
jgi:hypothetical protein